MTDNYLDTVREALLAPAELSNEDLEKSLGILMAPGVDSADLYFQSMRQESWSLEDSIVKQGSYSINQGVGVRAIAGDKTGFAYSDEIVLPSLLRAAEAAAAIARSGNSKRLSAWKVPAAHQLYPMLDPLLSAVDDQKVALLQQADVRARALDPRVQQVMASLSAAFEMILVCASDGTLSADIRPLIRMNVSVIVEESGRREQGFSGGGGRHSYDYLLDSQNSAAYVDEAVRQALVNLEAGPAPAGEMTVVLAPGWPGVLLHEAIGHGLEGDFNRKGTSAFSNLMGEKVASEFCTIVDDGAMPGRRGSLNIDDEGTVTRQTTLIENGRLVSYMQDKMNARLMGVEPTGNGRRESYAHPPLPRMTNTYMLPGPHDPAEIIASVKNGLYARNFAGGQVDITSGKFVFSASESYLIKDGKLGAPVKDATLIGDGPSVLNQVSMVGNDLELDTGIGVCGKEGQSVPVGVGQPTLKIDRLTVGGVGI
ncbi:MAG: metalloprotease TldD [Gammaproteobacteria bacterium]|nr:metalloprotease TldD [Gammaproteobacteria bacterium]